MTQQMYFNAPSNRTSGTLRLRAMSSNGEAGEKSSKQPSHRGAIKSHTRSWFTLPAPIRRVFDTFPLTTYDANELPQRASISRSHNTLHIFAAENELSPNPACLKWQAYLLIKKIPFNTVSANNHASPTGALPFLLPAQKPKDPQPQAIPSSKIQRWAESQGAEEHILNIQLEAYLALVDQNIRSAWLYALYVTESNLESVARSFYVDTASMNPIVRFVLLRQLNAAAKEELLKTRTCIDAEEIYEQVEAAFKSLSTKLGKDKFFNGHDEPGLFDVTLFSYTHLILQFGENGQEGRSAWRDRRLMELLKQYKTLVIHRNTVLDKCRTG